MEGPTPRRSRFARIVEVGALIGVVGLVFGLCGLISTADPQPLAGPSADSYLQCAFYSHTLDVAPPGKTWESDDPAETIIAKVLKVTGDDYTVRHMRKDQAYASDTAQIYTWTDADDRVQAVARITVVPGQGMFLDSFSVCDSGEGAAGMRAAPPCPDSTGGTPPAGFQCSVEDSPAYGSGRPQG